MKKAKPELTVSENSSATPSESPVANFENALQELEQLVTQLEKGEHSLEESLQSFERGIALFRQCQTALETAELRVNQLLDPGNPTTAKPFDIETP